MKKKLLLCAAVLTAFAAQAQLQTKTVSIFKNGQSFFAKEGNVALQQGTYTLSGNLPAGLFGTIWFTSKDGKIKQIVSSQDSVLEQREAGTVIDLMQANVGAGVSLLLLRGAETVAVNGTIEKVFTQGRMAQIKTAEGKYLMVSDLNIVELTFAQAPKQSVSDKAWKSSIAVKFSEPAASTKHLGLIYLRNNLGWSPNYLLELQGEKKGKLTLRAEVVNNAEDIENATVNFVVGNPNFSQATRLSPLVDFGASAYTYETASRRNYMQSNISYDMASAREEEAGNEFQLADGVEGKSNEDLFFYTQKEFTLKAGQRAYFNLLEADVEVEHIYECNLSSNQVSSGYYQKEYTPSDTDVTRVYHSLSFKNNTTVPWTTGSALVLTAEAGDKKPLSQDMLRYTPPKGEGTVKLTASPDIQVNQSEKELDREEQKLAGRNGQQYDLVTVSAQIKVKNYKSTPVKLSIARTIQGETLKSNMQWETSALLNLGGYVNKTTEAKWSLDLKPGEEKVIEYSYKVFVGY